MTSAALRQTDTPVSCGKDGNIKNDATLQSHDIEEVMRDRNVRVAVVGNVDAGKSTLIGTLTTSTLDDGRGKSRSLIMKHRHELESGRTSTISEHLLGFKDDGEPISNEFTSIDHKRSKGLTEDEVVRKADRVATLMDLAGHEKYLKTTIHGVSSGFADYALVLVNSRQPPTHMTQHHLNLCSALGIPLIVVLTKIDGCPKDAMKNTRTEIAAMLRDLAIGKKAFAIRNELDIETIKDKLQFVAPVVSVSCVSGEGLNLLQKLLYALPQRRRHKRKINRPFELLIENVYNVTGVGPVVYGFVNAGELQVGETVFVGPMTDGTFIKTIAKSAHIAKTNVGHVSAGESACLALSLSKQDRKKVRKGMVVLKEAMEATRTFEAEVCVLKGEGTTIRENYEAVVHILHVKQTARITNIEIIQEGIIPTTSAFDSVGDGSGVVLRPGGRAKVRFEFKLRPEYIRKGMRMLFRDGHLRGIGVITDVT